MWIWYLSIQLKALIINDQRKRRYDHVAYSLLALTTNDKSHCMFAFILWSLFFAWQIQAFAATLESRKITVSIRQTRGLDASAACGQLRNEFQKSPLLTDSDSLQLQPDIAVACWFHKNTGRLPICSVFLYPPSTHVLSSPSARILMFGDEASWFFISVDNGMRQNSNLLHEPTKST